MEPPILEYARFHGVATNHLAIDASSYLTCTGAANLEPSLDDADEVPQPEDIQSMLTEKHSEKLDIGKREALLLSSIIKAPSQLESVSCEHGWDGVLPDYRGIRRMKVEEPILRHDHELDMLSFRAQVSLDRVDLDLPLEPIDDERDEGLAFPSYCQGLPSQMQERTTNEKLDCTRETLHFMEKIRDPLTSSLQDVHHTLYKNMTCRSKQSVQSITPPLLSRDPTPVPFVPPGSSLEMDVASDEESLILPERDQMHSLLTEDFNLEHGKTELTTGPCTDTCGERMLVDIANTNLSEYGTFISPKRPLLVDPKVDGPITPPVSAKKRCTHDQRTPPGEVLRNVSLPFLPDTEESACVPVLDDNLAEDAISAKNEIDGKLDSEHFRTVDPSIRARAPCPEDSQIIPPWSNPAGSPSDSPEPLHSVVAALLQNCPWGSELEAMAKHEKDLQWNPFPKGISKPEIVESIEDNSVLEELLVKPDIEWEIGKDGLFLLPQTSRLTFLTNEEGNDEDNLIFPRHLERNKRSNMDGLHNEVSADSEQSALKTVTSSKQNQPAETGAPVIYRKTARGKTGLTTSSSLFSSQFSAGKQLAKFMDIRGRKGKRPKVEECSYFKSSSASDHLPRDETQKVADESGSQNTSLDASDQTGGLWSIPDIPNPPSHRSLVIDCSLLRSHLSVIRKLEALSPPATLVFRDSVSAASGPGTPAELGEISVSPGSVVEQQGLNKRLEEAHIILSPKTAILLTTSQETTQLYLPGHRPTNLGGSHQSPLWDRICSICLRYERLYLLICHSALKEPGALTMDNKTANSVRSLASFCSSLNPQCHVCPLLVPSTPEPLTQWVISLSNKHHFTRPSWASESPLCSDGALLTPEDPTTWELFLRRAGLNSYAAQVVLSLLGCRSQDAVTRFVSMDPHERERLFGPVLGERVLSRVNKLLGVVW